MNAVASYFHHLLVNPVDKWYPMLGVYYLTYRCEFRCPYCSDGNGVPYFRLQSNELTTTDTINLLKALRRHCDYLVITGGEPTLHPHFSQIISQLPDLGFRGVILTTNGYRLNEFLPWNFRGITDLVISLQTLDSKKGDAGYGFGRGIHQQILNNIQTAARTKERNCKIIISSVITPDNIPDLFEVYAFCQTNGFYLAACPQLVGVKSHPSLATNSAYRDFFNFLIQKKQSGERVYGTVDYLKYMRDLKKFDCRPFTMLVVSPTGDVYYPCLELGNFAGNLVQESSLHQIRKAGERKFGPPPACGTQCHSACALGFSRLLANPASALSEAWLQTLSAIRNFH